MKTSAINSIPFAGPHGIEGIASATASVIHAAPMIAHEIEKTASAGLDLIVNVATTYTDGFASLGLITRYIELFKQDSEGRYFAERPWQLIAETVSLTVYSITKLFKFLDFTEVLKITQYIPIVNWVQNIALFGYCTFDIWVSAKKIQACVDDTKILTRETSVWKKLETLTASEDNPLKGRVQKREAFIQKHLLSRDEVTNITNECQGLEKTMATLKRDTSDWTALNERRVVRIGLLDSHLKAKEFVARKSNFRCSIKNSLENDLASIMKEITVLSKLNPSSYQELPRYQLLVKEANEVNKIFEKTTHKDWGSLEDIQKDLPSNLVGKKMEKLDIKQANSTVVRNKAIIAIAVDVATIVILIFTLASFFTPLGPSLAIFILALTSLTTITHVGSSILDWYYVEKELPLLLSEQQLNQPI